MRPQESTCLREVSEIMLTICLKKKVSASMVLTITGSAAFEGLFVKGLGVGKNWQYWQESGKRQSSTTVQVVLIEMHMKHTQDVNIFILIVITVISGDLIY